MATFKHSGDLGDIVYALPTVRELGGGEFLLAAHELGFVPQDSFVVGDQVCDIELGRQIKATTFLVRTGYGMETALSSAVTPDYIVDMAGDILPIIKAIDKDAKIPVNGS